MRKVFDKTGGVFSSILFLTLFLLLSPSPSYAVDSDKITINEIISARDRGFDYIDIYTSSNIKPRGILLDDQLIITFPQASFSNALKTTQYPSKRVGDISTKETEDEAQLVIGLKKDIEYEIASVFGRNKTVVEIHDRNDYIEKLMAAWEQANLKEKGDEIKPFKFAPVPVGKDLSLKGKVIVVDPGHGGKDPGAFSIQGIPEKRLTLQTARKLAAMLSNHGATVYLTRNEDRHYNLKDIVSYTNKAGADIFICLHYNYNYDSGISGTETYYYNYNSRRFARIMHGELVTGLRRKDRGLHRAMFYTIHHTDMPGVLVESAYLSNREESKLAASPDFQGLAAESITRGVLTYFRSRDN